MGVVALVAQGGSWRAGAVSKLHVEEKSSKLRQQDREHGRHTRVTVAHALAHERSLTHAESAQAAHTRTSTASVQAQSSTRTRPLERTRSNEAHSKAGQRRASGGAAEKAPDEN